MSSLRAALEGYKEDQRVAELIKMASKDRFLGESVLEEPESNMHLIYHEGELAGLAWIKRQSGGYYQLDSIFVDPKYRGKGVATDFLKIYYANKKGRAWIESDNHASVATFTNAGFKKKIGGSKRGHLIEREFDQYLKD